MKTSQQSFKALLLLQITFVALIYFLSAKAVGPLSLEESGSVFAIWPPTGIALFALFLFGPRIWLGILIGALAFNMTITPFFPSFQIAITNTLGPIVSFYLLQHFASQKIFDSAKNITLFFFFITLGSLVTSIGGSFSLWLHSIIDSTIVTTIWTGWFLGDLIGFLLIAPIAEAFRDKTHSFNDFLSPEGVAMIFLVVITSLTIFGPIAPFSLLDYPVVYFLLPPLIWATLRFNFGIAVIALLLIAIVSIYGTILGYGPFVRDDTNQSLLLLQSFNGVLAVTILFMASILRSQQLTEEELRQIQQITIEQSRQAAMGEILSTLSHQWRQPLGIITMNANNILADIELELLDDETLKKHAISILNHSSYLTKTITDFKGFLKKEEEKENTNLKVVMKQVVEMLKEELDRHSISIDMTAKPLIAKFGTSTMYQQIFLNLINNAKDAIIENNPDNKTVKITIAEEKNSFTIDMCNTGLPIPDEIRKHLFEPYFTTKGVASGKGLGLYMSKLIVERYCYGTIEIYNTENGVCVRISLPKST